MQKLLTVLLLGCLIISVDCSYAKTVPCEADVPLQDCFEPKDYIVPIILLHSYSIYAKVVTYNAIACYGTYLMAMYLPYDKIPKKYWLETTCDPPALGDIKTFDGNEIENILMHSDSPFYAGLNLEEIREKGGQPIIFEVTFSGGPDSGQVNVYGSTEEWNETDNPPKSESADGPFITPLLASLLLKKSSGTITGSVTCDTHGGIEGCEVQVWSCCTQMYNAITNADGSFTINNVAEGDYSIKFLCFDGHYVDDMRISVKAGETITIDAKAQHE